jgi:hypothetical protein
MERRRARTAEREIDDAAAGVARGTRLMAPVNHLRGHWSVIALAILAILGLLWALFGA